MELQEKTKVNREEEVALDGMLFLDEFNDVFPAKKIELPPIHDVDHTIDVITNVDESQKLQIVSF